jgi:phosphoenolpyruvate carboxykinase (ATP)
LLQPLYCTHPIQVAGTEMGVTEPEATFSACYGGAFLVRGQGGPRLRDPLSRGVRPLWRMRLA